MKQGHDTPARAAMRTTYAIMYYAATIRDCRRRLEAAKFKLALIALVHGALHRPQHQLGEGRP